jgi:CubicO group peptidase (beta-lactamase class C family)
MIDFSKTFSGIFFLAILLAVFFNCHRDNSPLNDTGGYHYQIPVQVDDGWEVADPSQTGMSSTPLVQMIHYINQYEHRIHSVLVFHDNKLVFEQYFEGYLYSNNPPGSDSRYITYGIDTLHYLASVSKTVTSVLVGIAHDQGNISNISDHLSDYFLQYANILVGEKANITIEYLLTMTSGLAWDENSYPYTDPRNDVTQLFYNSDPIGFILSRQLISTPGTLFHYNSGNTNVLGDIVRTTTGMNLDNFSREYLFKPLGITRYRWERIRGNIVFASGGLYLTPRDLAKIGSLFINGGKWKGQQVISQDWIDASTHKYISTSFLPISNGYGYQWWLGTFRSEGKTFNCFLAAGWGEQYMFIFPDQNLIVVTNCGYYFNTTTVSPFDLVNYFILPALSGS